ncbi:MAG: nuclease-related domain-containing protein [Nitrolancea sp.]
MRLVRNNGYVKTRRRLARLLAIGGFLLMMTAIAAGFFIPVLLIPSYIILFIGFIAFNVGMPQTTKWGRHPRPDEILDDTLRRLNDRYTLIHFSTAGKGNPEHVLVYPGGLVVITTREVQGRISVDGNKWRKPGGRILSFIGMAGPQIGNPTMENERDQDLLRSILTERNLPGEDAIDGIIVFLNPKAALQVGSTDLSVVTTSELLQSVRDLSSETVLTSKDREAIVAALSQGDNVEGPVSLPTRPSGSKRATAA